MVEWLKKNFALKNIAWIMLILSSAKLVNNAAELARVTSEKVVVPLGKILSEYDTRREAVRNMLTVAAVHDSDYDECEEVSSDDEDEEEKVEEKVEKKVETKDQKSSFMENFKKGIGWM